MPLRRFTGVVRSAWPDAKVIGVLHYAHRMGHVVEERELARVRTALVAERAARVGCRA